MAQCRGAEYCDQADGSFCSCLYVCLFVRLPVCLSARMSQKPHIQISSNFLYMLYVPWLGPVLTAMQYIG